MNELIMAIYKAKPELALLHGKSLTGYALLRQARGTTGSNDTKQSMAKLGACVLGVMILGKDT